MNELIIEKNNEISNINFDYNNLVNRFLKYIDVSENSIETYKNSLKQFAIYINENNIEKPTREDILNYKEYLKINNKPNTINLYLASLKNFYKWLEYENITKDITKNVKSVKVENKHLRRSITPEEIKKVLSNCKDIREELLIKLMTTCGLREIEVVNIQLKDFYNDNGAILLKVRGKGRDGLKSDVVRIDERIFDLVQKYCEEYNINDYLFTSTSNNNLGGKLTTKTIRLIVTNLFKKSNLDRDRLAVHSLRHFSATQAIKSGMDLLEVSEMMRHSNVSTTQIYIDEMKKSESKFANVLSDIVCD